MDWDSASEDVIVSAAKGLRKVAPSMDTERLQQALKDMNPKWIISIDRLEARLNDTQVPITATSNRGTGATSEINNEKPSYVFGG